MVETTSFAGHLLVATPRLEDPNFDRTVILLLQHDDDDGAMGLVLNRPSGLPLDDELSLWEPLAAPPSEVFMGGPVEAHIVFALGWYTPGDTPPDGIQPLIDGVGVVDLRRDPDELAELLAVRLFAGYSGWAPRQLEAEIAEGSWFTLGAEVWDAATVDPDNLWRDVFRRQQDNLRLLATYPDDPSTN